MSKQKRAAIIEDLSAFGKCSLTVSLPILSAVGIECSVIPTTLLSTHTGGFENVKKRDLTNEMKMISSHWKELKLQFDAIYIGYLGRVEQIELAEQFIEDFKAPLVMIDPVMGDNGRLYKGFTPEYCENMRELCKYADLIVPNMTEATVLCAREYRTGPYSESYIKELVLKLEEKFSRQVVLTGVHYDDTLLGVAIADENKEVRYALKNRIDGAYHGTGDVFASVLLGGLMNGKSLYEASLLAADFTARSIFVTKKADTDPRYGVKFEQMIPELIKNMGLTGWR